MTTTTLPASHPEAEMKPTVLAQLGKDAAYLLTGFPIALVSFTVLVTGLSTGLGLLITLLGIPVLVVTLQVARLFAAVERWRVELTTGTPVLAAYRPIDPQGGWLRRWWDRLRDTQAWLDALHGMLVFALATVTWSIAVTWIAGAGGGVTYWLWSRALPTNDDDWTLTDALDLPWPEWFTQLLLGVLFLVTLIPVLRGCTWVQTTFSSSLLGNRYVAHLQDRITTLTESRTAAATAEVDSLRRLERDLHDGPQQRLVRLQMDLAAAERRLAADDGTAAAAIVTEARAQTADALAELRALTRGIAPPILADRGLAAALTALADRSTVPTSAQLQLPQRYAAPVETAAYFVASEALANVAKHSGATAATVRAWTGDGRLAVEVIDNGVGGASLAKGHGLAGLADRVAALDGSLGVESPEGGPTTVRAVIPCA
ncbi:sensor histidine kinase [Nocardioides sp.]|uniref:sensor histidine kinase n=1 Tax=Nocardioides sp. TaxID=35761 RepID=UPI0035272BC7